MFPTGHYKITYHYNDGTSQHFDPAEQRPDVEKTPLPDNVTHMEVESFYPMENRMRRDRRLQIEAEKTKIWVTHYFLEPEILTYQEAVPPLKPKEVDKLRNNAMQAIEFAQNFLNKDKETEPEDMYYIRDRGSKKIYVFSDNCAVLSYRDSVEDDRVYKKINRMAWNDMVRNA